MKRTYKRVKKLKLGELIEYVKENSERLFEAYPYLTFYTECNKGAKFYHNGNFKTVDSINLEDLFLVEEKEEITGNTVFDLIVGLYYYDGKENASTFYNRSVSDIEDSELLKAYALIEGELELVYINKDFKRPSLVNKW